MITHDILLYFDDEVEIPKSGHIDLESGTQSEKNIFSKSYSNYRDPLRLVSGQSQQQQTQGFCDVSSDKFSEIRDILFERNANIISSLEMSQRISSKIEKGKNLADYSCDGQQKYPEGHKCRIVCDEGYGAVGEGKGAKYFKCVCDGTGNCDWTYGGKDEGNPNYINCQLVEQNIEAFANKKVSRILKIFD